MAACLSTWPDLKHGSFRPFASGHPIHLLQDLSDHTRQECPARTVDIGQSIFSFASVSSFFRPTHSRDVPLDEKRSKKIKTN